MHVSTRVLILFLVLGAFKAADAAESKFPILWHKDLQTFLESAATVAALDGDNRDKIIVAGREELFALDGEGKMLWRWRTKGRFMTYPAVLTRAGQLSLIYAADNTGLLTCLDGKGKEVWKAQLKGPSSWSASVICDLRGDNQFEVIQTDESGTVSAFEALTGKPLWQAKVKGVPVSPAVGDLDGDGKPEIVVATGDGIVTAMDGSGQVLWERNIGGASQSWATSAPVIFGASDGRSRIVAASSDGQLMCFSGQGELLWRRSTRGAVASSISTGDLDADGRADICLITQIGVIHRFDESGDVIWELDMQGRSLAPGAMVDLDGDGKLEYVLCTQNGLLLALNNAGEFLYRYQFNNRTINVTPAFGEISSDSAGLEMVITGGEAGILFCHGTPASAGAVAHWKSYRCDARNSGSWFGLRQRSTIRMFPANLTADEMLAGENIQFIIDNPRNAPSLAATAVCIHPQGARQTATTTVLGKRGELSMPLEIDAPGTYHFEWTLADSEGRALVSGNRSVFLQPFANERALAARALMALEKGDDSIRSTLPLSASALRREAVLLEGDMKAVSRIQDSASGNQRSLMQEALKKTAALVTHARRSIATAEAMRKATLLGAGTSLIVFEGTMWENRGVDKQLPRSVTNPLRIERTAVPGEHEPVSINLFNITERELLVRVRIEVSTNGINATPRRSVGVPTSLGEISWDALPELDETATLTIPSLTSREIWLDLDLAAAKPGEHRIAVRFEALNGAGVLEAGSGPRTVPPPENRVEIALRVPAFHMAPPGNFRLCTWAAPEEAQLPDLLSHGNNVFTVGLPSANYDEQGHLQPLDFHKLDPVLARLRGKDVVLLLQGLPNVRGERGSSAHRNDLKSFLEQLVKHLEEAGFDTNHFALYPFDEPGGVGWSAVNQLVEFGKQVHEAHPGVMLYVDGGGELPMFQAMASCIDIWCPSIYMLAEKTPVMDVVRKSGKMLWSYNCGYGYSRPVGPNLKNMNMIGDYRAAAPFAFRHGGTGIGFWCYNLGGDPWGRIDMEYMLVYPGRTKPIPSRRWEAVREGVEDYRILAALKTQAMNSGGDLTADVRDRIKHLIEISLPGLVDQSLEEMTRGLGRSVIDASNNDTTINTFRHEMLQCVEAVARASTK